VTNVMNEDFSNRMDYLSVCYKLPQDFLYIFAYIGHQKYLFIEKYCLVYANDNLKYIIDRF